MAENYYIVRHSSKVSDMDSRTDTKKAGMTAFDAYEHAEWIEKEEISTLRFPSADVLFDPEEVKERSRKIHRATSLGNLEKYKVSIVFEDSSGLKKVSTTIWAQTEKKIILKGGTSVPVNRIWDVVI